MAARNHKYYRLWGLLLLFIVLGLALTLTLRALQENIIFFYAPNDLIVMEQKPQVAFRLGGLVLEDSYSLSQSTSSPIHRFNLSDGAGNVAVRYQGILPDLFREGQGIIGKGRWLEDEQLFEASELLAKHDENYMPTEVADALKKTGQWRE